MRVLTIAEEWSRLGGAAVLLSSDLPTGLADRCAALGVRHRNLKAEPGSPDDVTETGELWNALSAEAVVVDGYQLGRLSELEAPTLAIDDFGLGGFSAVNLLLDQNAGSCGDYYSDSQAKLLLGADFCLLRKEFLESRSVKPDDQASALRILVTLGGADPDNVTTLILDAIREELTSDSEVDVVVGAANPYRDQIAAVVATMSQTVNLHENVSNMAELMSRADLAVAAPGVTSWELAYMGVPMLLVTLAENQRRNGEFLDSNGIAKHLGSFEKLEPERLREDLSETANSVSARQNMVKRGRKLIDGRGVSRVCRQLQALGIQLAAATPKDARQWWEWSNDPGVRAVSFSSADIPWETHLQWFDERLGNSDCRLQMARDSKGKGLGQVRFDLGANEATISVSLAPGTRGRGLGTLLIWMACDQLFSESAIEQVVALIKPDNLASVRAFEKVGFVSTGETEVKQQPARRFTLERGAFT